VALIQDEELSALKVDKILIGPSGDEKKRKTKIHKKPGSFVRREDPARTIRQENTKDRREDAAPVLAASRRLVYAEPGSRRSRA